MELFNLNARAAAEAIKKQKIKAAELTDSFLKRIGDVEDIIKALITVTPDLAKAGAEKVDKRIAVNEEISFFAGIPVVLGDEFSLKDVKFTAGSKLLKSFTAPKSAAVVEKLSDGGAVFVGKGNIDEFCMGNSTESSFFKVSANPYDTSKVAGCGVTAAIAAGEALIGISSDTGGNLLSAASYCGVTALKPSAGTISRFGMSTYSSSFSQAGIVAREAGDISPFYNFLRGYDPRDAATAFCNSNNAVNKKHDKIIVGYPDELNDEFDSGVAEVLTDALQFFSSDNDYEIKKVSLPSFSVALQAFYTIAISESFSNLSRYDGIRFGDYVEGDNLEERYLKTRFEALGEESRRRSLLGAYLMNNDNYGVYYSKALALKNQLKNEFASIFQSCDLIILPVTAKTAPGIGAVTDFLEKYNIDRYTAPVSMAGIPALALPVGFSDGLPVGLQLVGDFFAEDLLTEVGTSFQNKRGIFFRPEF